MEVNRSLLQKPEQWNPVEVVSSAESQRYRIERFEVILYEKPLIRYGGIEAILYEMAFSIH